MASFGAFGNLLTVFKLFKNKYAIIYLLLIQLLTVSLKAQLSQFRFKHYTTADGLSQGNIYHIIQDSRGFMWFGSFDGLDRFDGYNFKVFRSFYNDSNSIKGEKIASMIEDRNGMIWVGTNEALNCYDFITDRFKHFYVLNSLHQNFKTTYDPFFIDDKNELWFTYDFHELGSMNLLSGKISTYPFVNKESGIFSATCGYPEKQYYRKIPKIYSVGGDGLHIIDLASKQIQYYFSSNPKNKCGRKTLIEKVLEDRKHVLWLSSENGLISLNPATMEMHLYDHYDTQKLTILSCMDWDQDGNIWCGSYGMGLYLFDTAAKKFTRHHMKFPADEESIGQNSINSLFIDRDNDIWLGIDPDGIDKINLTYEQFYHVKIAPEKKNLDYTNSVWAISEIDTNNLLICFNHKDLILFDKKNGTNKEFYLPGKFRDANINYVTVDSRKGIWIVSERGICYSDNRLKTIRVILNKDLSLFPSYLFENDKTILIGSIDGLFSLPLKEPATHPDTLHVFDGKPINFITRSPNGLLSVATGNKEWFLIRPGKLNAEVEKKRSFDFLIKSILFQDENIVWFGTSTGLVRYNISKDLLKIYTEKEGLANNYVYSVLRGNDGNLWMSTNHGISKFNPATERFVNYGLAEGAQALEYNTHSFYQSSSGAIYFGGVKGFNYFNPLAIKKFDFKPPIQLLHVSVNGGSVTLDKFLEQTQPVKFRSTENNISIEFAAIDFNRNDNINYLYKLRNKDVWTSIGNQRTLNFANLSPGNYHLEVEAQYSYNTISPYTLKLSFIVLPPMYKTSWFIMLMCLLVILIIYGMYKYRIRQFLKLQSIRNNIARDLHDEVGATLSGLSMYSHLTRSQLKTQQTEEVEKSLNIMQQSASDMVTKLSDIVWAINPDQDSLQKLTQKLEEFAVGIAGAKNIKVEFSTPAELARLKIPMASRRNIYLLCKEAINNAVKYSQATILEVGVYQRDHILEFIVNDNGKGFDQKTIKKGNGLVNMQRRADEINARLSVQSQLNRGVFVSLQYKIP